MGTSRKSGRGRGKRRAKSSVRGLVELANEVIAFKRDRTGRSDGDETEQSEVAGAAPLPLNVDGDVSGTLPAVVEVVPGALPFLVPDGSGGGGRG